MIRQMALINKMSHASPNIRITAKLFKFAKMPLHKRLYHSVAACVDYAKQTNASLSAFYFYNLVQIPVFILMVMSIRKIATENDDLTGAGVFWFPNLNEPDAYLILPIIATVLNYINLGVSNAKLTTKERHHKRKRALVRKPIPVIFPSASVFPPTVHSLVARRRIRLLDR